MKRLIKWTKRLVIYPILILVIIICVTILITEAVTEPSNNRDWSNDQAILPYADINGSIISIHNIRNFSYASTTSYSINYYDKTFNLDELKKVWYVVEPFSGFPGSAHTFLSFEFNNNQFVSISIEIRKEKGEKFSALKGLFNKYEIMYVIADERDVIKLRSNYRKDEVFVYPVKTTEEKARNLFLGMITRANKLKDHPEFYNSLTNTCTTNIVAHVNSITPKRVPLFNFKILLPANSDALAYSLGLIDTNLPFIEAREKYHINKHAQEYADNEDFSVKIRATD